jgi:hypothetical protein
MTKVTGPEPAPEPRREPLDELREHLGRSRQALDDISRVMKTVGAPGVLETATVTIGAHGYLERSYRIPYASVAISNYNLGAEVIVTSAGPQGSAPGGGQGQIQVPPGGGGAWNISGQAITFYGPAGTVITYTVMINRIQPQAPAAAVTVLPSEQPSITAAGAVTSPAAGAAIAATAALGTGLYRVDVRAYMTGDPAAATDADNMALLNGAAEVGVIPLPPAASTVVPWTAVVRGTGAALTVQAIGAGTATVVYRAVITATQIGP